MQTGKNRTKQDSCEYCKKKLSDTEGLIQGMKDKVAEAHAKME